MTALSDIEIDGIEGEFDGEFHDLCLLIGEYGGACATSGGLAAKGRGGENNCYEIEKQARLALKSALLIHIARTPADGPADAVSEAEVTSGQVQDAADVLWRMLDLNNHTVDGVRRAARACLEAAQRARK